MRNLLKLAAVAAGTAALATATAEARITRIEIAKTEPAFARGELRRGRHL
jgi:hypothetical protein